MARGPDRGDVRPLAVERFPEECGSRRGGVELEVGPRVVWVAGEEGEGDPRARARGEGADALFFWKVGEGESAGAVRFERGVWKFWREVEVEEKNDSIVPPL